MSDSTPTAPEQADERVIIRRVLQGAKEEFRHLVQAYQEQVYHMILRQVGDAAIARDLTQEAFVKAYVGLSTFQFGSAFSTWLVRIALNVTNNYFSSRGFKERMHSVSMDSLSEDSRQGMEARDGVDELSIRQLQRALGTLPPKHREVLVLCALEQKSYADAAVALGIPVGTVRSRLNKARHLVRKAYFEA